MGTSRGRAHGEPKKPGGDLLWLWLLLGALALVILAYVVDGAFRDDEQDADRFETAQPAEIVAGPPRSSPVCLERNAGGKA
ncbi:hypothetical protein [Ornithinimicrobium sediminis]|uniref:hypothetical protein n=1 Tax=Ornithinimicrobium sediminis TaxID=2904603 RepID=UPI001E576FB8|nr:hypothetical protein [Ornithinimicrobium sediminis]MCE0485842.1 hypothetical protein [Ornithinimicrobium sediminis]